jgi:uncharacterized protein (DUF1697 family)
MQSYVALLRAVNVGGTGKLPMEDLRAIAAECGFAGARTYIASGNLLFRSALAEAAVRAALEARLAAYAGKKVGVLVRGGAEMAAVAAANPFPGAPGNRVMVIFLHERVSPAALQGVVGQGPEEVLALGDREIYVRYGNGQADSKLRIPAAKEGTARNMNTVTKLAELALS